MTGRFRWIIPMAFLIAVSMVLPPRAAADVSCTSGYESCLNSSWDKTGFAEYMSNLECGLRLARCLRDIIIT
jgi:hypothetical protein